MTPVLFPFTHLPESQALALADCFSGSVLYRPSSGPVPGFLKSLIDSGRIQTRMPASGDEEKLEAIVREYLEWARMHQGGGLGFFRTRMGEIPFFDDLSAEAIRADILRKQGKKAPPPPTDPLLEARIFLSVAQEHDERFWEVQSELNAFSEMETALLREIRDEAEAEESTGVPPALPDDPGWHMTSRRLAAWSVLALEDTETFAPSRNDLLPVSGSRAVLEALAEGEEEVREILRTPIPAGLPEADADKFRETLNGHLEAMLADAHPAEEGVTDSVDTAFGSPPFSLVLYWVPGEPFRRRMERWAGGLSKDAFPPEKIPEAGGFLFGMLEG